MMVSWTTIVFGLVSCGHSLQLVAANYPSVLQIPIQRLSSKASNPAPSRRSAGTLNQTIHNGQNIYFTDLTLGNPGQSVRLHLDTGSSDLWTNTDSSPLCAQLDNPCAGGGLYIANDSSTYHFMNDVFSVNYADGSYASGDYATDSLGFPELVLPQVQFGIAYNSSTTEGVLGLGYMANEVQATSGGLSTYANLPQILLNRGVTQANAYSLWLNDLNASTGSILFGGVNTAKFDGSLATVPIIPQNDGYSAMVIALTGVALNGSSNSITCGEPIPVLLDSGSTITYLPVDVAEAIIRTFGGEFAPDNSPAVVDCDFASQDITVDFSFSSSAATVRVPANELVFESGTFGADTVCTFGIAPTNNTISVLGDTFLRSAYVVFDLGRNEISLAQTTFNSTEPDNIFEIAPAPTPIPDSIAVASPVATIAGLEHGSATNSLIEESAGLLNIVPPGVVGSAITVGTMLFLWIT